MVAEGRCRAAGGVLLAALVTATAAHGAGEPPRLAPLPALRPPPIVQPAVPLVGRGSAGQVQGAPFTAGPLGMFAQGLESRGTTPPDFPLTLQIGSAALPSVEGVGQIDQAIWQAAGMATPGAIGSAPSGTASIPRAIGAPPSPAAVGSCAMRPMLDPAARYWSARAGPQAPRTLPSGLASPSVGADEPQPSVAAQWCTPDRARPQPSSVFGRAFWGPILILGLGTLAFWSVRGFRSA